MTSATVHPDAIVRNTAREQRKAPLTEADRAAFLDVIAAGGTITTGAAVIGRPRSTMKDALDRDPAFATAFELAYESSADVLEVEAWRRATTPDKHGRYSDRLLEMLLRARRPWRYRATSSLEVSGPGGGPVRAEVVAVDARAVLSVLADAGLVAPVLPAPARQLEAGGVQTGSTPTA